MPQAERLKPKGSTGSNSAPGILHQSNIMYYHRLDPKDMQRAQQFRNERAAMLKLYTGRDCLTVSAITIPQFTAAMKFVAEYLAAQQFPVRP